MPILLVIAEAPYQTRRRFLVTSVLNLKFESYVLDQLKSAVVLFKVSLLRRWGPGPGQCRPKVRNRFAFPGARKSEVPKRGRSVGPSGTQKDANEPKSAQ